MPIPETVDTTILIGSLWRRRVGKHSGEECTVIRFNGSGVTIEREKKRRSGWESHAKETDRRANVPWEMFSRLYEQVKEGPKVETTQNTVEEPVQLTTGVKACTGALHRGKLLPLADFSYTNRIYQGGRKLRNECNDCVRHRLSYPSSQKDYTRRPPKKGETITKMAATQDVSPVETIYNMQKAQEEAAPRVEVTTRLETTHDMLEQGKSRWKVTVISPHEHVVWAKDFLDAAAMFTGEIVKIERL